MPGMLCLGNIFQLVVDGLYDRSFAEQYPVPHGHQNILHVVPDARYQVQAVVKEHIGQFLRYISFVGIQAPYYFLEEIVLLDRGPIVHICLCDNKIKEFPLVIDHDMELETMEPSHGGSARGGDILEHPIVLYPFIVADPQRGGIYKRDAGTFSQTTCFHI